MILDYEAVLLDAVDNLTPLPTSALEIVAAVGRVGTELLEVAAILETDPGLLGHVLKEANSAGSAARGTIATAQDAVVRLGTGRVASIAVYSSLREPMNIELAAYNLAAGELSTHAFLTARAGAALRDSAPDKLPLEISTACVLHDIGKLLIASTLRRVDRAMFSRIDEFGVDWATIERDLVGVDHGEVGRVVLEHWNLHLNIARAVQYHHRPEESDDLMAYGVALADGLVHRLVDPEGGFHAEAEAAIDALGISSDRLTIISSKIIPDSE
ncbi:MAG: HDOD domain-containing protein [Actinomycetota bacterium]|nr:HDOD domain-containing protein [Actinomycetota bacterium]